VVAAILEWRQHPTEIECDLSDRGRSIFEWHRGTMSSRELLVLLRHAPERGPYKAALREGDWPEDTKILAELHKEVALNRAGKYAGGQHAYTPKVFLSPVERVKHFKEAAAVAAFEKSAREELEADVFGE
jgi:hypothetical protein